MTPDRMCSRCGHDEAKHITAEQMWDIDKKRMGMWRHLFVVTSKILPYGEHCNGTNLIGPTCDLQAFDCDCRGFKSR